MKIGLTTEGTYPLHPGGVSVWCDQLVTGMAEHDFYLMAACANAGEAIIWDLPGNVVGLLRLPLWGPAPPRRRPSAQARRLFADAHLDLVTALAQPERPNAVDLFENALRAFHALRNFDLEALLLSNDSLNRLLEAWNFAAGDTTAPRRYGHEGTFADALSVTDTVAHLLRPLSLTPPEVHLVHAVSNGLAGLLGLVTKWTHGAPLVLTEHGVYLRERYLGFLDSHDSFPVRSLNLGFFRLLTAVVYRNADVIRPGSHFNQRWEVRTGADPDQLETIYNGIDPGKFGPSASEPTLPTITWIGRIDPLKDLHTLIRAFALVVEEMPEACLRLFGRAPAGNEAYLESCKTLAAELGLQSAVTFEGPVTSASEAYDAGHIFVLSSVSEGFPYALLEAMASSKASVATDVGGVSEAVGDAGIVVPARDPVAMARACLSLLNDDEKRRRLGVSARLRVHQHFTMGKSLAAYRDTYLQVLGLALEPVVARADADSRREDHGTGRDALQEAL